MRLRLVALFVLVGLSAAACTGGSGNARDSASPTPTGVTSTHSTPTSTPPSTPASSSPTVPTTGPNVRPGETVPSLTAAARKDDPQGALSFAVYWFRTLDWGYATTDSTLVRDHSAASCAECARLAGIFDRVAATGNHLSGGHIFPDGYRIRPADHHKGSSAAVDVTYRQSSVKVINPAGMVVQRAPALKAETRRIWLSRTAAEWVVVDTKEVVYK